MLTPNPTKRHYEELTAAYHFFNKRLFGGKLPNCLITMQRTNKSYGFFAGGRFGTSDGEEITDEIALNPSHFRERTTEQNLSTLVHEMAHLCQHHLGTPPRRCYHNKEWATMMKTIGLIPSATGQAGGKETGQRVSHYIDTDGAFTHACAALLAGGFVLPYIEIWGEGAATARKRKAASKTKYTCPDCGVKAWAKPEVSLLCGECETALVAEEDEETEAA